MVYWSMQHANGPDIIYYAYANSDFTDFEDEPKVLFTPKNKKSCIDGDIINKNGLYYMFYKTEGHGNGIKLAITDSLTSGKWIEQPGYKQQTRDAVEGSSVFKMNHSDKYILMYDVYGKGKYQFCETCDLDEFKVIDHNITMDFHPRHGTIIPISRDELLNLTTKWGVPSGIDIPKAVNPVLKGFYADPDVLYSNKTKKYYIYPTSDGFDGWGGYYFKTFEEFCKYMKEKCDDDCMEYKVNNNYNDSTINEILNTKYDMKKLLELPIDEQKLMIHTIYKNEDISIRTLSRITGISKTIIEAAVKKDK